MAHICGAANLVDQVVQRLVELAIIRIGHLQFVLAPGRRTALYSRKISSMSSRARFLPRTNLLLFSTSSDNTMMAVFVPTSAPAVPEAVARGELRPLRTSDET